MKLSRENTTVICPLNDAESFAIIRIAKRLNFETRVSMQNTWFCPLPKEPPHTFLNLKKNVIVVEMPGEKKEKELGKHHDLFIIDHHDYPSFHLNRDNSKSSLEQFAALVGYTLTSDERAIAINDQTYIYGLARAGYSKEEIKTIRQLDLSLQGYTDGEFRTLEQDISSKEVMENGTYIYRSSVVQKYTYLLDLHVLAMDCRFSNVVIFGQGNNGKGKFVFFSGHIMLINELKKLGGFSKKSSDEYGLWGGYEAGDERVDVARAIDMIKDFRY